MDYESACPASPSHTHTYPHAHTAGGRRAHIAATLEEQLLSYSENAENEGEEEEYLEEEVLQVRQTMDFLCSEAETTFQTVETS